MFYSQNSTFIPNIINTSNDQEQIIRRKNPKPFGDRANLKTIILDKINQHQRHIFQSEKIPNKQNCYEEKQSKHFHSNNPNKNVGKLSQNYQKANIIVAFSSDEELQDSQQMPPVVSKAGKASTKDQAAKKNEELLLPNPKINNLLLAFSDQQSVQQEEQQANQQQNQFQAIYKPQLQVKKQDKSNLILQFQDDCEMDSSILDENGASIYNKYKKQSLFSGLSCNLQESFYLQPIPENMILQCIIKREKKDNGVFYSIYDSTTLRNFMNILRDEDGYLMISNTDLSIAKNLNSGNKNVVAKLISNFFGTQFNCYLCNYQYKKSSNYPINTDKQEKAITIEYETNFFGFKGPRKMTAYIPAGDKAIVKGKSLSEIYQKEKKKKMQASVLKFRNKTPKWNKNIEAYVLNFYGRATISSIKNFIMIKVNESEDADARVLFGKFGKELFNLDIRHPFNLIQGIALALSSFDRKLACE